MALHNPCPSSFNPPRKLCLIRSPVRGTVSSVPVPTSTTCVFTRFFSLCSGPESCTGTSLNKFRNQFWQHGSDISDDHQSHQNHSASKSLAGPQPLQLSLLSPWYFRDPSEYCHNNSVSCGSSGFPRKCGRCDRRYHTHTDTDERPRSFRLREQLGGQMCAFLPFQYANKREILNLAGPCNVHLRLVNGPH